MKLLKLGLALVVLGLAGAPFLFEAQSLAAVGEDPVWAEVCCGTGCIPEDYCTGDGTYTCCKE